MPSRHVIRQPENAVSLFQAAYVVENTSRRCGFATHTVYQFPRAGLRHTLYTLIKLGIS